MAVGATTRRKEGFMLYRRSYVVLVVAFLGACGKHETPTAASSPSPVPVTAATPTPAPTPSFPGASSCSRLPIQTKDIGNCPVEGANFQKQVDAAVAQVRAQQPEIFAEAGPNTLVLSSGRLLVGVIENLDKMGLCAGFDSEEIQVTNDPSFNDQYHLITSRGYLRTGESTYRATCHPAAFPTPRPPFNPTSAGCKLPSSLDITCGAEQPVYDGDVESALDQVIREHPEAFEAQAHAPHVNDGYLDIYHQWFIQAMVQRGYCGWWDSEEVQIKKENRFSEHYKIFLSDGHVRRVDGGAYRSTCWPAAF
jgi:hypothetical protein